MGKGPDGLFLGEGLGEPMAPFALAVARSGGAHPEETSRIREFLPKSVDLVAVFDSSVAPSTLPSGDLACARVVGRAKAEVLPHDLIRGGR